MSTCFLTTFLFYRMSSIYSLKEGGMKGLDGAWPSKSGGGSFLYLLKFESFIGVLYSVSFELYPYVCFHAKV